MKTYTITFIALFLISLSACAEKLDGYKYIIVRTLTYQNGGIDNYGISSTLRSNFEKKGLIVLSEEPKEWFSDARQNACLILYCMPFNNGASTAGFIVRNCKNEIIFDEKSTSANWANDYQDNYNRALKNCWLKINKLPYAFNPSRTPSLDFPSVPQTKETEETIKTYLTSKTIEPIEGIFKSYQSDQLSYYKFGIIKQDNKFQAIIIESEQSQWKQGEVKAIFEPTSMKGFYSVKWYMSNKEPSETFGMLENEGLLSIEFKNPTTGEKSQDKFIKMFPLASSEVSLKKDSYKSSGSGFFMNVKGVIATNAHVVEGANNIEVSITNELTTNIYKAKILLMDSKNDVALLQIDDEKFKGLSTIPYGFTENSDVGSKVFTIGYPLNDIMGTNYKVTDGIISSKSGIADDVRYYQISVPLQPGNSGGPLFNKDGNVIALTSSRLNSKAVGTQVENANYAIKSSYLLNLYHMLPNSNKLANTSQIVTKELQEQVKILKNYVCLIKVFN